MIEPKTFGEVTRTVSVTYPVPFLVAILMAAALGCFAGALATTDMLRWLIAGTGAVVALIALGIAVYAVICRPELLRSEQYNVINRYIDLVGDDRDRHTELSALDRTMLAFLDEAVPKKVARAQSAERRGDRDNAEQ